VELAPGKELLEGAGAEANDGVVSFIGIAGSWAGTGSLSCSPQLACRVCAQLLMTESSAVDEDVLDAVAELTNMVIGSVKTDLETHLGPLGLSIPTVVFGRNFRTRSAGTAEWMNLAFDWEGERLLVKMCLAPNEKAHAVPHAVAHTCALDIWDWVFLEKSMSIAMTMSANENAVAQSDTRAGKYLTFQLSNEEFGIRVLKVREIMGLQEITAVPQTPVHVKGVINLRGKVVPVVDLRLKFGLAAADYTQRTCIIVTQVHGESGPVMMGIVVDGVSEVLNLTGAEIEDTPDFGEEISGSYLLGMAKVKGKVKILLDIDRVLSSQDLHNLNAILK
jgi:chemotaxis signal transduction protein/CheY-specific phosphatase CheX